MKIYLDCCCLQRPFDDKSQPRIAVEAEAILVVFALCESDHLNLISSDALLLEINQIPDQVRKEDALEILNLAKKTVELTSEIEILAREFGTYGIKTLDALHICHLHLFQKSIIFGHAMHKFLKKAKRLKKFKYQGGIPHRIGDGVRHMKTAIRPISEINRQATNILFKEMGVVETIRFLNQFSVGRGNYTKDRGNMVG